MPISMMLGCIIILWMYTGVIKAFHNCCDGFRVANSLKNHVRMVSGDSVEDDLMGESKFKTFDMESERVPDGYLNADIKKMAEGQKSRVMAYIGLALLPCLFLVPFFLSRDFSPPTID